MNRPPDQDQAPGRIPPHDIEAERAALGACLIDPDVVAPVLRILRPADCYDSRHAEVLASIVALHRRATAPDVVLLKDELLRVRRLDAAGGEEFLRELSDCPTAAHAEHYARIVREHARRRSAIYAARAMADRWASPNGTPFVEDLRAAEADLRDLAEGLSDVEPEPLLHVVAPPAEWMTAPAPPRPWLLRHPDRDGKPCGPGEGDGMLARGITGILAGEGGSSKTMTLLQLGVCVVTGRPWIGRFVIDRDVRWSSARVLLALAEEEELEARRRVHAIAKALELDERERAAVSDRVRILPLAGVDVGLLVEEGGTIRRSTVADELAEILATQAGADGWALVGLDPLARWAGLDIESDNRLATRWVEALEEIAQDAPGRPTVLAAAHSSKFARRLGDVDARGVTGLTDGGRWFATIARREDDLLEILQRKSNYSRPWSGPVVLEREAGGVLRALTESEEAARQAATTDDRAQARDEARARQAEADVDAILAALDEVGEASGKEALASLAMGRGLSRARARGAIEVALHRGVIVDEGSTSDRRIRRAQNGEQEPLSPLSPSLAELSPAKAPALAATGAYVVEAPAAREAGMFDTPAAADGAAKAETGEVAS